MKLGVSCPIQYFNEIADMGFDYLETQAFVIMGMDNSAFSDSKKIFHSLPIEVPVFNMFFSPGPAPMSLLNVSDNHKALKEYAEKLADRVSQLGGKIVVLGSGRTRHIPDGMDKKDAVARFTESLSVIGDIFARYNLTLVLEPLRFEETNCINTVKEGSVVIRELGHSNVKLLADFYHMRMCREPIDDILCAEGILQHAHIACLNKRAFPTCKSEDIYDAFFSSLKQIGYTGRLSIEGETEDFLSDAKKSLAFLRQISNEYFPNT